MSEDITTVADVPESYSLITGSHERDVVLSHVGIEADDYSHGSLFVDTNSGEYTDVLFFSGNVPRLSKDITRLV
jgi:hypothetical protein